MDNINIFEPEWIVPKNIFALQTKRNTNSIKKSSHKEKMERKDHLYDLILIIEYNTRKIVKGKGSAIFIHIAKPKYKPTQGCVALTKKNFLHLLKKIRKKEKIKIIG